MEESKHPYEIRRYREKDFGVGDDSHNPHGVASMMGRHSGVSGSKQSKGPGYSQGSGTAGASRASASTYADDYDSFDEEAKGSGTDSSSGSSEFEDAPTSALKSWSAAESFKPQPEPQQPQAPQPQHVKSYSINVPAADFFGRCLTKMFELVRSRKGEYWGLDKMGSEAIESFQFYFDPGEEFDAFIKFYHTSRASGGGGRHRIVTRTEWDYVSELLSRIKLQDKAAIDEAENMCQTVLKKYIFSVNVFRLLNQLFKFTYDKLSDEERKAGLQGLSDAGSAKKILSLVDLFYSMVIDTTEITNIESFRAYLTFISCLFSCEVHITPLFRYKTLAVCYPECVVMAHAEGRVNIPTVVPANPLRPVPAPARYKNFQHFFKASFYILLTGRFAHVIGETPSGAERKEILISYLHKCVDNFQYDSDPEVVKYTRDLLDGKIPASEFFDHFLSNDVRKYMIYLPLPIVRLIHADSIKFVNLDPETDEEKYFW